MSITRRHALRRQALAGLAVLGLAGGPARGASRPATAHTQVPARWAEAAALLHPGAITLGGWLGGRVAINASRRLLQVDTAPLLAGFQHKPGSHPWIGEHVGKWLHAATLAWAHSADPALRARILQVSGDLIAAQEADGYLGTYLPAQRFGLYPGADWDVWSHKYSLIGLLAVHRYLGLAGALRACRRAADLLLARFGPGRSILGAGTHLGMAATSVLEPMVLLYRATGDARYLRFAQYLVRAWDEPGGPAIASALLQGSPVTKVANGKAYEMLSNLVGLCELSRATGQRRHLQAVLAAWQDIVDKRLYATGTTSQLEYFQPDHDLRDGVQDHVGETCVTTTWIQLNLALLQLTGQARFGDELERSLYNHLTAAQHPAGADWCYFTALQGRKKYDAHITCCHSSGPRGLALAPQTAYLHGREKGHDVLLISSFEPSGATLRLGGQAVRVDQQSGFPYTGRTVLRLSLKRPARFAIKLRAPAWSLPMQAIVLRRPAPVHGPGLAAHVVGRRRAQKDRQFAQLLGRGELQRGLLFGQQRDARLVGRQAVLGGAGVDLLLHQGREHPARADGVDGDARGGGFQRRHLGEAHDAVLGRHVGALGRTGHQAVHAGDVDDAAPVLRLHARQARRVVWKALDRLMAMMASQRSTGNSSMLATCWMPALLTSTSTPPKVSAAKAIMASISAGLLMSAPW
jgi:hypothetical protein